jgi:FdhD protein
MPGINSEMTTSPEHLIYLVQQMLNKADLYHISGGIHSSALCDSEGILVNAEDIGRHNTIDKICGECLFRKISTKDKILITTGRISSEMLRKAVKMEVPIVASLTTPTEEAIRYAKDADVTLVGRVGRNCCTVYNDCERLIE